MSKKASDFDRYMPGRILDEPVLELKFFRERAGLSQRVLAGLLNVEQDYIEAIENGSVKPTDMEFVVKLAHVLNTSSDELLGKSEITDTPSAFFKI